MLTNRLDVEVQKKSKKIVLKLNGAAFNPKSFSPTLMKLIKYLDSCPPDEIFEHGDVARKLGLHASYIKDNVRMKELADYTAIAGQRRYVGSPRAIRELKRQMGEE